MSPFAYGKLYFNITLRYRTNLETNQSSKQFIELPLYKLFVGRTLPMIREAYQSLLCSLNLCYSLSLHFTRSMGEIFSVLCNLKYFLGANDRRDDVCCLLNFGCFYSIRARLLNKGMKSYQEWEALESSDLLFLPFYQYVPWMCTEASLSGGLGSWGLWQSKLE